MYRCAKSCGHPFCTFLKDESVILVVPLQRNADFHVDIEQQVRFLLSQRYWDISAKTEILFVVLHALFGQLC